MPVAAATIFHEWSKNIHGDSVITLIPWASIRPSDILLNEFQEMGDGKTFPPSQSMQCHMVPSSKEMLNALDSEFISFTNDVESLILSSTAIFFFGGDQNVIMQVFDRYPSLAQLILRLHCEGLPIGGTSAGAAFMSKTMITGEGDFEVINCDKVEVREGLGLVQNAVIDQHFIKNKRLNRLISVLMNRENRHEKYGIGIDEDMAISLIDDKIGHVFEGERSDGKVVLLKSDSRNTSCFSMQILDHGCAFTLEE